MCSVPIALGADIWPIPPPTLDHPDAEPSEPKRRAKGRYWWTHAECARKHLGGALTAPPCLKWVARGECAYGAACFYSHPPEAAGCAAGGTAFGMMSGESAAHDTPQYQVPGTGWVMGQGGGISAGAGSKKRKKVRNSGKTSALRRFLHDAFGGAEGLRAGSGIVDVAGGKGDLSFEVTSLALFRTRGQPRVILNGVSLWAPPLRSAAELLWCPVPRGGAAARSPARPLPCGLRAARFVQPQPPLPRLCRSAGLRCQPVRRFAAAASSALSLGARENGKWPPSQL